MIDLRKKFICLQCGEETEYINYNIGEGTSAQINCSCGFKALLLIPPDHKPTIEYRFSDHGKETTQSEKR